MAEKEKMRQSGAAMPAAGAATSDVALGLGRLYEEEDGDLTAVVPDGEPFTVFTEHGLRLPGYPG